jgi:DNA-binding MarR family transcriptional regulator
MSNGVDKAQVSRAIKRMSEIALVTRGGIRSPIRLSHSGRQLADRLLRQAELRNRELTFGITDDQLVSLFGVLDTLLSRAVTLFEQERKLSAANQKQTEPVDFQDLVDDGLPDENGIAVDRSRILPPFITLCSYMLRGGALAHKRKTGLSNFESWVLVEVCRESPISWPQLVIALSRDQSQAGRTVNHLIDIGLIERTGKPGRRHGFFGPTEEGRRICEIINETAMKRSEFLFQGIAAPQLDGFMTAFEMLSHNAEVQVAREKAIQEMDRS